MKLDLPENQVISSDRSLFSQTSAHWLPHARVVVKSVKLWINKVWPTRAGGLFITRSLLALDSFSSHLTRRCKLRKENIDMAVFLGFLTKVIHPLDVCLNKPFKDRLRLDD